MKISVSMYSLHSSIMKENWTILDFLTFAKSIGLEGVELLDFYWKDVNTEWKEVVAKLNEYELSVSAYDVSNNFVKENREERNQEIEKVKNGIHLAKLLGTNIVRVFCGDLHENIDYEQGKEWIIESLRECAKLAEAQHVYLAIENHGLLAGRSEQVREIIDQVKSTHVKSTFDTGNFLLVHENPLHAFEQLKHDIVHVHFKDFRRKSENESLKGFRSIKGQEFIGVIPGEGDVPILEILSEFKSLKYNGWLSIEYEGHDDAKNAVYKAVQRLKQSIS
jgi:sugar phosphate isomerase/epimerase